MHVSPKIFIFSLVIMIIVTVGSGCSFTSSNVNKSFNKQKTKELVRLIGGASLVDEPPFNEQQLIHKIKVLLHEGADAKSISLTSVLHGNSFLCEAMETILRANLNHYRNEVFLNSRPDNDPNTPLRRNDLVLLSNSGLEKNICHNVITLLAKTNPVLKEVRNSDGETALHVYLKDIGDSHDWRMKTAKLLMNKRNVNMQTYIRNFGESQYGAHTPIHTLLSNNTHRLRYLSSKKKQKSQESIQKLITEIIKVGGNLDKKGWVTDSSKNKNIYISVRDYIKLTTILNNQDFI